MTAAVLFRPAADALSLLDQLLTGVAIVDEEGRLVHCNPAFVDATGLSSWRGCPVDLLDGGSGELRTLVARALRRGAPVMRHGFELAARDPPLRVTLALAPYQAGMVLLELHVATATADPVPNVSRSLRGLAHEVKNPLAGLRGAAQLLKRRLADAEQQKLADLVIAEADRLVALTERLLQPGGKPALGDVNLHEVSERARALVVAEADPTLAFERDYDPSLPPVHGDGDRMLQLVLNLLRNALQAGARRLVARTRVEYGAGLNGSAGAALRLDIVDDGAGVPEALRETLFLPLVSGRADGTGLGLALAQEIAQEHGGQLTCRSRPGHTVFSLLLPLKRMVSDEL